MNRGVRHRFGVTRRPMTSSLPPARTPSPLAWRIVRNKEASTLSLAASRPMAVEVVGMRSCRGHRAPGHYMTRHGEVSSRCASSGHWLLDYRPPRAHVRTMPKREAAKAARTTPHGGMAKGNWSTSPKVFRNPLDRALLWTPKRRGFTLLKLPSLQKDLVLPPRVPSSIRRTDEALDKSCTNGVKKPTGDFRSEKCTDNSSSLHSETRLTERTDSNSEACSNVQLLVYQWPSMEKLTTFARKNLDSNSVLIFVTSNAIRREAVKMVYVWVGGEIESSKSVNAVDWQQVTGDFLHRKGLSDALPIKVCAYCASPLLCCTLFCVWAFSLPFQLY